MEIPAQRQLLVVKYLGELYNYRLVSATVIFDTLYSFIFFGHNGRPSQEEDPPCDLDTRGDFLRIRLICTLLETCGQYFNRAQSKLRLDHFLVYFQFYILTKDPKLAPLEVGFLIDDTLEHIRRGLKRETDYKTALARVEELEKEFGESVMRAGDDHHMEVEEEDDGQESLGTSGAEDEDDEEASSSGSGDSSEDDSEEDSDEDDDMQVDTAAATVQVALRPHEPSPRELAEFDQEYQKVMAESMESRRFEKRTAVLDMAIPLLSKRSASNVDDSPASEKTMTFQLLTKGGKSSTKVKSIAIPISSQIVTSTLSNREKSKSEREEVKRLVLETQD